MRAFEEYNPIITAVYFLAVSGIAMFCMNPVILLLSLSGALLYYFIRRGLAGWKSHLYSLGLLALMILINPLFSHNGVTVLFVINHNPVTLEAVVYGIGAGIMVLAVLYWFRSFAEIMTSDRLLYLFGKLSPKLALVLSMGLRYIPLFTRQARKISQSQIALGLYRENSIVDRYRGGMRVFSVMITWALENGIVTADSMSARGYGIGRRSGFSVFRFRRTDVFLLALTLILLGLTVFSIGGGALDFAYYPSIEASALSGQAILGYSSYGMMVLIPAFIEAEEKIKWKYLQSKI